MSRPRKPALERFDAKVQRGGGCWQWTGATQAGGYGRMVGDDGRLVLAHRFAYERFVGPIPAGLTIDHLCGNTGCVRVEHLEVVTREENAYRGNRNVAKTHCLRGHALVGDNVYVPPKRPTVRACRTCRATARDRRRAAA